MGAHALGAAAYAAKAVALESPDQQDAAAEEVRWQLDHMTTPARVAFRLLPPLGENTSGSLGPGLLASGILGTIIRDLQAGLADRTRFRPHVCDPRLRVPQAPHLHGLRSRADSAW